MAKGVNRVNNKSDRMIWMIWTDWSFQSRGLIKGLSSEHWLQPFWGEVVKNTSPLTAVLWENKCQMERFVMCVFHFLTKRFSAWAISITFWYSTISILSFGVYHFLLFILVQAPQEIAGVATQESRESPVDHWTEVILDCFLRLSCLLPPNVKLGRRALQGLLKLLVRPASGVTGCPFPSLFVYLWSSHWKAGHMSDCQKS